MAISKESTGFEKTIFSDLQETWEKLRDSVFRYSNFDGCNLAVLRINEAMSWEVVRDMERMGPLLADIGDVCVRGNADDDILDNIGKVDAALRKVLPEIPEC